MKIFQSVAILIFLVLGTFLSVNKCQSYRRENCEWLFHDLPHSESELNKKLLGPSEYGTNNCPPGCGCPETPFDCPRWYDIQSVVDASKLVLEEDKSLLESSHRNKSEECISGKTTSTGGWCLGLEGSGEFLDTGKFKIAIPKDHVSASKHIVDTLAEFIREEDIRSISDFGAGIGQYKAAILERYPQITYHAYDGAGNINSYTQGFVSFFDLTLSLDLPIDDWIVCFAVGEHVPSKFEGMVIRNLHRHNRKGIILLWDVLGTGGTMHINNHSNDYIKFIFKRLGYSIDEIWTKKFRDIELNYDWFIRGTIVFRKALNKNVSDI
jgi:hypothetical protein